MLGQKARLVASLLISLLFMSATITIIVGGSKHHAAALEEASIRKPLPTLPAPVLNGTWFLAQVSGVSNTDGWSIWIEAPGHSYNLTNYRIVESLSKPGTIVVNITVPGEVVPELYDLYINTGEDTLSSPRSVWVLSKWPEKLTIAHLTDIHIGVIDASGRTAINYMLSEVMLINMLPVDLVIVTGDNADVGSMVWHHTVFLQILNLLRKPSIVVPGNHEYAGDPNIYNYLHLVGYRYHSTRLGGFLLMGLDTGSEGYFDTEELRWAENLLAKEGTNSTVVMFWHHPAFQATVAAKVEGDPSKGVFTVDGVKVDTETHRPAKISGQRTYSSTELFYSSWVSHQKLLREMLEWTQNYNIALVLNGHVHNDGTVLFNNKTWFVTTSPAGGPAWRDTPGSHHGFRLVDIYVNGTVKVWETNGKPVFSNFNSIDMEKARADLIYGDNSALLQLSFEDLPDLKYIPENYEIWIPVPVSTSKLNVSCQGIEPSSIEIYKTTRAQYYVIRPSTHLEAGKNYSIAIYLEKDTVKPQVSIVRHQPAKPTPSSGVKISIKAVDEGWGVKEVYLEYRVPGGTPKKLRATPQYGRSVDAFRLPKYFMVTIPPVKNLPNDKPYVEVRAIAIDAAGNKAETGWAKITFLIPTATTTSATTTTTTGVSTTSTSTTTTATTTAPTTTTTTTHTTTTTKTTTTTQTTKTTAVSKKSKAGGINVTLILGVIGVAIIIVILVAILSRRS